MSQAEVVVSQLKSNKLKKSSKFVVFQSLNSEIALPEVSTALSEQRLSRQGLA